ncbi:arsenosugar biosynthesis radical SAM (seleno)protein ArsS [Synechococcus sp. CC9616]|uniref:arsenosugar biosynthesis radical SAM (seleno)protein ArsS n=1 Tax=Synechococcus sp. CC9616 TaxID=110663 RepID=UPI0004AED26F|nr:arsenosugar biosynthesis radical SAM (seleno)protein ArsS [Synechococcus sp. CC9616]
MYFLSVVAAAPAFPPLQRTRLRTLQLNLGYRCNQSCSHCHVNAGPGRTERMDESLLDLIPTVVQRHGITCVDLTGGAPELHSGFRDLVRALRGLGVEVIDRCNLTILSEPGQEDLADFLASEGVTVIASLPCYSADNVDRQRGDGVFTRSVAGLRQLNALGYGTEPLPLHLVYNPQNPVLPPPQSGLEADYRRELAVLGLRFSSLLTLANMPIQRFARDLERQGQLESYQLLLEQAHNPDNLAAVMCRELISVDWQGNLYDCDFNQQLGMELQGPLRHLQDLMTGEPSPEGLPIRTASHCFGCTAGAGSSCGGALQG